jgi:pimeloyl-ACP methyl ester carboxylesterase
VLRHVLGIALLAALLAAPAGHADGTSCGTTPGLVCSTVDVPLDRSGAVAGTISLHVEVWPAAGMPLGAVFLIAGGPGQGSAHVFDLGSPDNAAFYRFLFPNYTIVAYDDRGTGVSGLINCPALQNATVTDNEAAFAATCAASLGTSAGFYGTADHAEDLEAIRKTIGFNKVALWGVSYGTKLALAYALAHPDHVERLLLDSVVPPELPDPFSANVARALPATMGAFCAGLCNAATPDIAADIVTLANRLAAKPARGNVLQPNGKTKSEKVDGTALLGLIVDADLNPGLAAELPAVLRAARLGNVAPLLRMVELDNEASKLTAADLSFGLFAATVCRDGPFPWTPATAPADRAAVLQQAIAATSFGSFGSWAAKLGNADLCQTWPSPAGGAPFGTGPLPNVPVLALSGGFDMRTPTASAAAVVARFPQGRLLVVPGVGHSVVTADSSGCAARAVRSWMLGQTVPDTCARPDAFVAPLGPFPLASKSAGALQTYTIAAKTLREAEATWLMTSGSGPAAPVAGLYAGKLVASTKSTFTLVGYSIVRGVTLSGKVKLMNDRAPFAFQGLVSVSGTDAAAGVLGLKGDSLRGTLGGRSVG